ncbi:MAG: hypothetical protein HQM16_15585 [Deltaproteobacteria bacterium]|nr:hypothetical protein [Deltaproteobacteria bacterium]
MASKINPQSFATLALGREAIDREGHRMGVEEIMTILAQIIREGSFPPFVLDLVDQKLSELVGPSAV